MIGLRQSFVARNGLGKERLARRRMLLHPLPSRTEPDPAALDHGISSARSWLPIPAFRIDDVGMADKSRYPPFPPLLQLLFGLLNFLFESGDGFLVALQLFATGFGDEGGHVRIKDEKGHGGAGDELALDPLLQSR